jgi:hypothetical protein
MSNHGLAFNRHGRGSVGFRVRDLEYRNVVEFLKVGDVRAGRVRLGLVGVQQDVKSLLARSSDGRIVPFRLIQPW